MWRLTSEMEKIFIRKTCKSISTISAEEDGLIKSFHLASSIFFEVIWTKKLIFLSNIDNIRWQIASNLWV